MTCKEFLRAHRAELERNGPFEARFVEEVLCSVSNLDFSKLRTQTPFRDSLGTQRRIDFTIQEAPSIRIAIEVDGWDKTGRGTGMTKQEFEDWSRREADLVAHGWTLLRFANTHFLKNPKHCARIIELVLQKERAAAAERGGISVPKEGSEELSPEEQKELSELNAERQQALEQLQKRLQAVQNENRSMRTVVYVASAAVVSVAVLAIVALQGNKSETGETTGEPLELSQFCPGGVSWTEAQANLGEVIRVFGPVTDAHYASNVRGSPTFLNVGRSFPDPDRVTVVIWGRNRSKFSSAPESKFLNREICVQGEVELHDGTVEMEVSDPSAVVNSR